MEKIVNLTGHDVTIQTKDGDITIPPENQKAKARYSSRVLFNLKTRYGSIPVVKNFYHRSTILPPERDGTYYIVSKIVAEVHPLRNDLLIINGIIRDGLKPIGCKSLAKL